MTTVAEIAQYSNKSPLYLGPVITLGVLSLSLVVARIYTRLTRTGKLHLDDKLILVAEPLSITTIGIAIAATSHGWGKPLPYFTPSDLVQTMKLNFALQTVWLITFALVRLSVACSLLRFGTDRAWRWPLYLIMGFQVIISSGYFIIQFAQCKPIAANWDSVPGAVCWPLQPIIDLGWVVAGVYIVMDLILSLMPIRLIRTLSRSRTEKILICILMSLGLLATSMACAKMTTFTSFGKGDLMQDTIKPSLWAKLEEQVGIIASSLPCLKSPVESLLKRCGVLREHQLTQPSFVGTGPGQLDTWKEQYEGRSETRERGKENSRVDSVAVALTNIKSSHSSQAQLRSPV
ncbi:hypothetical protein ACN47E_002270 [Coniothyrium glycines]